MIQKKVDGLIGMIANRNHNLIDEHFAYKKSDKIAGDEWVQFISTIRELRALLLSLETQLMFDSAEEDEDD